MSFATNSIKDNYNRLLEVRRSQMGLGPGFVKEEDEADYEESTDFISDINSTWSDPVEAGDDVRMFLVNLYRETEDDIKVQDMIDAITRAIGDAKRILNI